MGFKIIWTKQAVITFQQNIEYLQDHWTKKEIIRFNNKVNGILQSISENPEIFIRSEKNPNVHRAIVIKQISLVYHVKLSKKQIELITFWNNRRNPAKYKY